MRYYADIRGAQSQWRRRWRWWQRRRWWRRRRGVWRRLIVNARGMKLVGVHAAPQCRADGRATITGR